MPVMSEVESSPLPKQSTCVARSKLANRSSTTRSTFRITQTMTSQIQRSTPGLSRLVTYLQSQPISIGWTHTSQLQYTRRITP